jgi:hypothetical protein
MAITNIYFENQELIKNLYFVKNLTPKEIAVKLNLSQNTLSYFIHKTWGRKNFSEAKKKYKLNESIFNIIDEEWKSYFLGWMFTDGNLYKKAKKNTISLCITESDKYILDYFNCKIFNCTKPLNYRKERLKKGTNYLCKPLWRFQIDSKMLIKTFENLGIVENKSLIIQFPKYIELDLMKHFIRGVFEGDGCISVNRIEPNRRICFFSASQNFIKDLQTFLKDQLQIDSKIAIKQNPKNNLYILSFFKKADILKFKNYIYKDCEMYLKRKYEKFNK